MDSPRDTTDVVVESDGARGRSDGEADRDLRDVLRHLVVAGDGRDDVSLSDVAAAVQGSERLVPELLAALDDDARPVRMGASWTLCRLAEEHPSVVEYLAERLTERKDAGDEQFEVGQVLAFLRGRYPGRVADAIDAAVADDSLGAPGESAGRARTDPPRSDEPVRTDGGTATESPSPDASDHGPEGKRIETDGGVPAGTVTDIGDNRQVVRPDAGPAGVHQRPQEPDGPGEHSQDEADATARAEPDGRSAPARDAPPAGHPTHPDFESSDVTEPTETPGEPATSADPHAPPVTERDHRPETPETFASIGALSTFDQLTAVDEGIESRYATGYRSHARRDDEELGVSVRLFDRPEESERLAFYESLEDALARWQALGNGDHVVEVREWGERPQPWVATQPVERALAERDRPPVDEALWHATALAEAVSYCHRHGAVHGGIDPNNVVYPGDAFTDPDRPMLDNVGLMEPFRRHFDPRDYLDPRFAAPEYFDDGYGRIDHATDVYQLGAVVYLLCTGRPPYTGSFTEIRRGVLDGRPPAPTQVNDALPDGTDDVVGRALAKEKLNRFESVEGFHGALKRLRERTG